MPRSKVTISLDPLLLERLDRFVKQEVFSNRSQAIQWTDWEGVGVVTPGELAQVVEGLNEIIGGL